MKRKQIKYVSWIVAIAAFSLPAFTTFWQSRFVQTDSNGMLHYTPDENGNTIPDFSHVGYGTGNVPIPTVPVSITVAPVDGFADSAIQTAIDQVSTRKPDKQGFRGAILLKKGSYKIAGTLKIKASGVVLRGEGNTENGTKLIASGNYQHTLLDVSGSGAITETPGTRTSLTDRFVPTGSYTVNVANAAGYRPGDSIILYRPATQNWIHDLKMDSIDPRQGVIQWPADYFGLHYERIVRKVEGNKLYLDNPVVMQLEEKYGGAEIYKYHFNGRIKNVGIEGLYLESEYTSDTAENHGWNAIFIRRCENGWVRNVTANYFGYSCVNLGEGSRNITVTDCQCLNAKSKIEGGRRYSFNNDGQLNLVMNCYTTEGRHDCVTGAKVCGPNVFYNVTVKQAHAGLGPHHRWASGTLYDNISTDGELEFQDRGNWGTGHGWAGVTQVVWNCKAKVAVVQSPYVTGKNYCIGSMVEKKYSGRLKGRPDGEWEGQNQPGLSPSSLYIAQLNDRKKRGW